MGVGVTSKRNQDKTSARCVSDGGGYSVNCKHSNILKGALHSRCLNQLGPPPGNGDGSDAKFYLSCLSHASRCTSRYKPCHYYEWAAIVRYGVLLTVDYYIVLPMGSIRMGWRKPILQGYSFSMTPSKMKSWYHLNHHNHKMQRHGHNEVHARLYSGSSWTNNF